MRYNNTTHYNARCDTRHYSTLTTVVNMMSPFPLPSPLLTWSVVSLVNAGTLKSAPTTTPYL